MTTRRVIVQAQAAGTPPVAPQQVGRDAGLIEEDILPRIPKRQPRAPAPTVSRDVGAALFVGVEGFF